MATKKTKAVTEPPEDYEHMGVGLGDGNPRPPAGLEIPPLLRRVLPPGQLEPERPDPLVMGEVVA